MKIKNDCIDIKIGKKSYHFRNMIFDNYIHKFVERNLDNNDESLKFKYILLKLDEPIQGYDYDTELSVGDFDLGIQILDDEYEQELSGTNIIATYFVVVGQYDRVAGIPLIVRELNYYNGRKICNIAFSSGIYEGSDVYTILDTSRHSIYIEENETISITRRDVITTDANFSSNNKTKVPAPAHLVPDLLDNIIHEESAVVQNRCSGLLYSVSTSMDGRTIEKEYIIGTDVTATIVGNTLEISSITNGDSRNLYYLGDNGNTYLGYAYLTTPFSKYLILKYKVFQLVDMEEVDTGYYYTLKFPINESGNLKIKINYERGE